MYLCTKVGYEYLMNDVTVSNWVNPPKRFHKFRYSVFCSVLCGPFKYFSAALRDMTDLLHQIY